jgi:hypothetical protein
MYFWFSLFGYLVCPPYFCRVFILSYFCNAPHVMYHIYIHGEVIPIEVVNICLSFGRVFSISVLIRSLSYLKSSACFISSLGTIYFTQKNPASAFLKDVKKN